MIQRMVWFMGAVAITATIATVTMGASENARPSSTASHTPVEIPVPVSSSSAVPLISPSVLPELTALESSRLLEEFRRSHVSRVRALRHQQKLELQEVKASQKARVKEWKAKEKQARRDFFKSTQKGADKRAWMQDHHKRREALFSLHKEEYKRRVEEQKIRLRSMQTENGDRLREFRSYLEKKERPPASLWAQPGT